MRARLMVTRHSHHGGINRRIFTGGSIEILSRRGLSRDDKRAYFAGALESRATAAREKLRAYFIQR